MTELFGFSIKIRSSKKIIDPDPVCLERMDPDQVNIRPESKAILLFLHIFTSDFE